MTAYRLASRRYSSNSSEGARLYGGRWNAAGTPVLYASSTISLATLEVLVHHKTVPVDYQVIEIEIPHTLPIENVAREELPEGWPAEATAKETAFRGTEWAGSLRTAVLCVPSAVIQVEYNYILNLLHPDFAAILFEVMEAEYIDTRLRAEG